MIKTSRKKILMVVLLLAICFIFTQSLLSVEASNRESLAFAKWFDVLLSGMGINSIRKLAHVFEYAVLGILFSLFSNGKWLKCFSYGGLIALLDETIQIFSGRGSMVRDVWIDCLGLAVGLLLGFLILKLKGRRKHDSGN